VMPSTPQITYKLLCVWIKEKPASNSQRYGMILTSQTHWWKILSSKFISALLNVSCR
jgi:hypothetical protein